MPLDNTNEILTNFAREMNKGKEPMREFKDSSDLDAWSNTEPYMTELLMEVMVLSDEFFIWKNEKGELVKDDIIEKRLVNRLLKFGLSEKGYARNQMLTAHQSVYDILQRNIAGKDDINPLENERYKRQ